MRLRLLLGTVAVGGLGVLGVLALRAEPAPALPRVELDHTRPRPQGDCYVQPLAPEPAHLNPFTTRDPAARRAVLAFTHDTLLGGNAATSEVKPGLATLVERDPDGVTFVLELREGVRFSDGAPLTMDDVLFTWELRPHRLPGGIWSELERVQSVQVLDARRLRLVLAERCWAGIGLAGVSWVVVRRASWIGEVQRLARSAGEPPPASPGEPSFGRWVREVKVPGPGTGPYQIAVDAATGEPLWQRGVRLVLVQSPHSWRRTVFPHANNLAALELRFLGAEAAVRAALRQGAIDWAEDPDPEALLAQEPALAERYVAKTYSYPTLGPMLLVWNHRHPALRDRRVRQALTLLIDRDKLLALRRRQALPAASWFPPSSGRVTGAVPLPHDIDRARQLLAEAGFAASPLQLEILVPPHPDWEAIVDLMLPDCARGGVTIVKRALDVAALRQRLDQHAFDGMLYAWNPDVFGDPHEVFHSRGPNNWMGYADPDADRILDLAHVELDAGQRAALWRELHAVLERDQPLTVLYHRQASGVLHRRFQGVAIDPQGLTPTEWWVEPKDQVWHFPP